MSQELKHIDTNQTSVNEEWRPVVGYEVLYEVSNLGQVKSLDKVILRKNGIIEHRKGKALSLFHSKQGYIYIVLTTKEGKPKREAVHRLVAKAFIPNENAEKNHIDHKDGNRENNVVSNIQWVTRTENMHNPITEARINAAIGRSVIGVAPDGTTKEYAQIKDVEQDGFNRHKVCACCRGMRKSHKSYQWRYTR